MNIIKQTGTHGLDRGARTIKYIAVHYTAGVTSKRGAARANASWFSRPAAGGTSDFIVDDEEIVQYNPDPKNYSCWAVGGSKYRTKGGSLYKTATNHNCVNIEICSNNKTGKVTTAGDNNWYFTDAAVNNAVALCKYLMAQYNIPADRVIRHYDVNGKICPGVPGWTEDSGSVTEWQKFKAAISGGSSSSGASAAPAQKVVTANVSGGGTKSNEVIASEVIAGKWGTGADRRAKLTAAGYDYATIQNLVNQKLKGGSTKTSTTTTSTSKPSTPAEKSVDTIAREVIAGKWGNGNDRKNRLRAAGYDPAAIQRRVNQLI